MSPNRRAADKKPTKENTRWFAGFPVVIEWDEGEIRHGKTEEGKEWERIMAAPYGYILGTKGAGDREGVDVYLGANENAPNVYVIEQLKEDGSFDEYKCLIGFDTEEEAVDMYCKHYPKSWRDERLGRVETFPIEEFREAVQANRSKTAAKSLLRFESGFPVNVKTFILKNRFPKETVACQEEAYRWAKKLLRAGFDVEFNLGAYQGDEVGEEGHGWLVVEGYIFDPTGGQFRGTWNSENYSPENIEDSNELRKQFGLPIIPEDTVERSPLSVDFEQSLKYWQKKLDESTNPAERKYYADIIRELRDASGLIGLKAGEEGDDVSQMFWTDPNAFSLTSGEHEVLAVLGQKVSALSPEDIKTLETLGGSYVIEEVEVGDYDLALIGTDLIPNFYQIGMQRRGMSMVDPRQQMETQVPTPPAGGWRAVFGIKPVIDRWLQQYGRLYLASHNPEKTRKYLQILRMFGYKVGEGSVELQGQELRVPYIEKSGAKLSSGKDDLAKDREKGKEDAMKDEMEKLEDAHDLANEQLGAKLGHWLLTADSPQLTPHRYEEFEQSTNGYALQPDRQKGQSGAGGTNVNESGAGLALPQLEDMAKKQDLNELQVMDGDKTIGVLRHGPPHATEKIGSLKITNAGWLTADGDFLPCEGSEHHGEAAVRHGLISGDYMAMYDEEAGELDENVLIAATETAMDLHNVRVMGYPNVAFDAMWNSEDVRENIANCIRANKGITSVAIEFHRPEHEYIHKLSPDEAIRWMTTGEKPVKTPMREMRERFSSPLLTSGYLNPAYKKWWELADEQRGAPEDAMLKIQHNALGAGVYSFAVEHMGDLTHRMSERTGAHDGGDFGYEFVIPKVRRLIATLDSDYGFEREMKGNLKNNYSYHAEKGDIGGKTFEQAEADLRALSQKYADAHRQLPTFNHVQKIAQDAAVALGEWRFSEALAGLRTLQGILDKGRDAWVLAASENPWGGAAQVTSAYKRYIPGIPAGEENVPGRVYLLHFDKPFHHARHYLGWSENAAERIEKHREGRGANIMRHVIEAGIGFEVARTWQNVTRKFERRLKTQGGLSRHCPICAKEGLICPSRVRTKALETPEGVDYVEICPVSAKTGSADILPQLQEALVLHDEIKDNQARLSYWRGVAYAEALYKSQQEKLTALWERLVKLEPTPDAWLMSIPKDFLTSAEAEYHKYKNGESTDLNDTLYEQEKALMHMHTTISREISDITDPERIREREEKERKREVMRKWREERRRESARRYSANQVANHFLSVHPTSGDEFAIHEIMKYPAWELKQVSVENIDCELQPGDEPYLSTEYAKLKTPFPPVILDGEGEIIDGMHRCEAARLRGDVQIWAYAPIARRNASKIGSVEFLPQVIAVKSFSEGVTDMLKFAHWLLLAANYEDMFKQLLAINPALKPDVNREIQWAKTVLKKNDRITWYLRWYRLYQEKVIVDHLDPAKKDTDAAKAFINLLKKDIASYNAKSPKVKIDEGTIREANFPVLKSQLEHYFALQDHEIEQFQLGYDTPEQALEQLEVIEEKIRERIETEKRTVPEPTGEGDIPFIKFGNGWAWWLLNRGECPLEARAMGHCGNQGMVTGNRILSLREPRKRGGQSYWEPHLTFILDNETKMLGEMKGRGNEKPAARYHPYIVSLLKDKRIKGIKGGGYMPSHNFHMDDLPEEERNKLEKAKPALMTLKRYLQKAGIVASTANAAINLVRDPKTGKMRIPFKTKAQEKYVINKVGGLLGLERYDAKAEGWILREWDSVQSLVEDKGDRVAQYIMEYETGDRFIDIDYPANSNERFDLLGDLPPNVVHNIGLTLEQEYPDELLDFIELQGGKEEFTWEPDTLEDVKDFFAYLEDNGVESTLRENLDTSIRYGHESGAMGEMSKALTEAIKDATDGGDRIKIVWSGDNVWGGRLYAVFKLADGIESAMECEEGDEGCTTGPYEDNFADAVMEDFEVKVQEPYNGFSDYDNSAAIEHMKEEYGRPPKPPQKKPVEGQAEMFPEVYEKENAPAKVED